MSRFAMVPERLVRAGCTHAEIGAWAMLALQVDFDTRCASFPSWAEVGYALRLSRRHVRTVVERLEEKGALVVQQTDGRLVRIELLDGERGQSGNESGGEPGTEAGEVREKKRGQSGNVSGGKAGKIPHYTSTPEENKAEQIRRPRKRKPQPPKPNRLAATKFYPDFVEARTGRRPDTRDGVPTAFVDAFERYLDDGGEPDTARRLAVAAGRSYADWTGPVNWTGVVDRGLAAMHAPERSSAATLERTGPPSHDQHGNRIRPRADYPWDSRDVQMLTAGYAWDQQAHDRGEAAWALTREEKRA